MKHRQIRFAALFITAVAFLLCILAGTAGAEKTGKVHGGWLNLRSEPSYNGKKISSYPNGTVVTITGQNGNWYEVKAPDGLTGYMLGSYLTVSGDDLVPGSDAWVTSPNGLNVRLRKGAGTNFTAIASYPPGTKCSVISKHGDYTKVRIGSLEGFMMTQFLTATDPGTGGSTILYDIYVVSGNGAGVHLRSGPSKSSRSIGFYDYGTKGGMIELGKLWSRISINGREGYMMTQFISTTAPAPYVLTGSFVYSDNGKNVNLRSGPGYKFPVINSFPPGTPVTILTSGIGWHKVQIYGKIGYMMAQYIITK